MKILKVLTFLFISLVSVSCSENQMAKNMGGSMEIKIKPQEKFINITWKENSLWILTKDTLTNTFYYREKSEHGWQEGEVIIR